MNIRRSNPIPAKSIRRNLRARQRRSGLTLIELLVAASILALSVAGVLSAWVFAVTRSIDTETRTAAYECARLVMERARSIGYLTPQPTASQTPQPASQAAYLPMTNSIAADALADSYWNSPAIQNFRFYNTQIEEIPTANNTTMPTPPAGAAYVATTQISYSGERPGATAAGCASSPLQLSCRDDLDQMTITVMVQPIDAQGVAPTPLITLQAIVSIGGL